MLSLYAAVTLLAVSNASQTVLLDFSADYCPPCRQMEPVIGQLAALGYPVRKVDVSQDRALAAHFRVSSIPCLVLVVDGREVERQVGAASLGDLQQMFARHRVAPAGQTPTARAQSPDAPSAPPGSGSPAAPGAALQQLAPRLLAASVRLKVHDPDGHSWGSGTIIDAREGEALVLTCGHIFRDSQGKGEILVDLFGPSRRQIPGRLLSYDLKSDVGLVSFRPGCEVTVAPLAASGSVVRPREPVINIGCNNGDDPTARQSYVTNIDKFLGPPNLQVAGQPVVGRSGGGLFNARGEVIGVCNAADPSDNEGLYAALGSIWGHLEQAGLKDLYGQRASSQVAGASNSASNGSPSLPASLPSGGLTATPQPLPAMVGELTERGGNLAELVERQRAEVICIVRPLDDPDGKSEVIVLDKASQEFLQQLAAERRSQHERVAGSRERRQPAASSLAPVPTAARSSAPPSTRPAWKPKWIQPGAVSSPR